MQELFDFMPSDLWPDRIIGDKAYDSDGLDERLTEEGIEITASHLKNRKPKN